jgi:Mrp family chromosome partitioning ATPase
VVASLAGFVLSSVFVMLAELFSGRAIRPTEYEDEDVGEIIDTSDRHRPVTVDEAVPVIAQDMEPDVKSTVQEPVVARQESLLSMAYGEEPNESTSAADTDLQASDQDQEFSVDAVARHLFDNKVNVAISVSLIGDEGSAAAVALARAFAELGGRTIVIDMTGSALPTRSMAENMALPGITNLLTGEAAFSETIHADQMSNAHIMPQGTADIRQAMRGVDRLAMIVGALANAYDLVLVECGPADVAGVSRIARKGETEIILSAAGAPMDEIEEIAGGFIEAGYEDVMLMLGRKESNPPSRGRKAA